MIHTSKQNRVEVLIKMSDVKTVGEAEQYISGCFDYQLFNPQSTLRQFYTPAWSLIQPSDGLEIRWGTFGSGYKRRRIGAVSAPTSGHLMV